MPRCRHCGGPGDIESAGLGYVVARGKPRLRFKCINRPNQKYRRSTQSIACAKDYRLLVPLSRCSQLYHSLSSVSKNREAVFRHWRDRYNVAGNNADTRPRRAGLAWQRLRASAALLLEWFRLSLRHGWLGRHARRNSSTAEPRRAERRHERFMRSRTKNGLESSPTAPSRSLPGSPRTQPGPLTTRFEMTWATRTPRPSNRHRTDDHRAPGRQEPLGALVVLGPS